MTFSCGLCGNKVRRKKNKAETLEQLPLNSRLGVDFDKEQLTKHY